MENDHAALGRMFLQAGAGALGTTLLAGCTGNSDPETPSTGTFTPSEN